MAAHPCGAYPGPSFCLVSAIRPRIRKAIHEVRVIACEQYLIRTIAVPNIKVYLRCLRPERDSDARPTAWEAFP
jgi:hypothetical protein